jgi:hypothetical protein
MARRPNRQSESVEQILADVNRELERLHGIVDPDLLRRLRTPIDRLNAEAGKLKTIEAHIEAVQDMVLKPVGTRLRIGTAYSLFGFLVGAIGLVLAIITIWSSQAAKPKPFDATAMLAPTPIDIGVEEPRYPPGVDPDAIGDVDVILDFVITSDGVPVDISAAGTSLQSDSPLRKEFDDAAIAALRRYRFDPARRRDGAYEPIPVFWVARIRVAPPTESVGDSGPGAP